MKYTHSQIIQDADQFVCLIRTNIALHHLLTNGSSAGCIFPLQKTLTDGLELCGLHIDNCGVFISCLGSHSDGTHSLKMIYLVSKCDKCLQIGSEEEKNSSTSWMNDSF